MIRFSKYMVYRMGADAALIHPGASALLPPPVALAGSAAGEDRGKPVLLFAIIGGISLLEIAALRFLSKDPSFPYSILIAATKVVSGESLIHSIHHDLALISTPHDED